MFGETISQCHNGMKFHNILLKCPHVIIFKYFENLIDKI